MEEKEKQIQESRKLLLDAAKKNPHVGEILKSTKRKLADYQSTESLGGRDSIVFLENESSVLRKDVKRKCRKGDVGSIFDIISEKNDDTASQASALGKVLRHNKMKSIVKEAGFADKKDDEYILGENLIKNQQTYLQRALETSHIRGRATDDKRAAAESIVTSLIATPENVTDTPKKKK